MSADMIRQCEELREALPDDAKSLLDRMLRGKLHTADAQHLYCSLPDNMRGPVLSCLHHWGMPMEIRQKCIRLIWKEDSGTVLRALSPEQVRDLFRKAKFPVPANIPQVLTVWRGTSGETLAQALEGLSWTLNRDAACWFATLHKDRKPGRPLVVSGSVRREDILFLDQDDGRCESEVIPEKVFDANVDPDDGEWLTRASRFIHARRKANLPNGQSGCVPADAIGLKV